MSLQITAIVERFDVAGKFIIARGAKTYVDVLVVGVSDGGHIGMGESTAIYYHGETAEKCLGQVMRVAEKLQSLDVMAAKDMAQIVLPCGAARNALDCALWDLAAKIAGAPLWQLAGLKCAPLPLVTAFTISLGQADVMQTDAAKAAAAGYHLLKIKLTGQGDRERVAAVHAGARGVRLIADANESWTAMDVAAEAAALAMLGVEMIEQPVARGQDALISGINASLPMIADESCQGADDVAKCAPYYDGVNIKLDKAGGLTEALRIADAADAAGLKIMVGCMLSTSLGIAPAFIVAQRAHWTDLDGPALLAQDRAGGFKYAGGMITI